MQTNARRLLAIGITMGFFCLMASEVAAIQVNVNDDISGSVFLNSYNYAYGQFDITPEIPSDGSFNAPYQLNNAVATFYFQDNYDYQYNGTYAGQWNFIFNEWNYYQNQYTSYYYRYDYIYYYSPYEQANISIDGQYSTDGTNYTSMVYYNNYFSDYSYYPNAVCYTYQYIRTYGYTGTIILQQTLGAYALSDLAGDGKIGFYVWANQGDLLYTEGNLTVDITPNPVPEPSTMLLLGSGLAGLVGYGKRRFKK